MRILDQISIYIRDNGSRFSLSEKGATNMEREKIRINFVLLDWNWRY